MSAQKMAEVGEAAWEAVVSVLSWIIAVAVLACLGFFAVADAIKRRRAARSTSKTSASESLAAASLRMELAS